MSCLSNFLLISISLLSSFRVSAQEPYYEEVLSYLNATIDVDPEGGVFEISKRPDGYYICTRFYSDDGSTSLEDCQQFWNPVTRTFVRPRFVEGKKYVKSEDPIRNQTGVNNHFHDQWEERERLGRRIYYGYPEWTTDTKTVLDQKESLTSEELELLARVHYHEANQFIHPSQYGLNERTETAYKDAGYEKISQERVLGFMESYEKCLIYWEKIREQDPTYSPSYVVELALKIANEYMHAWFTMKCIHEDEIAKDYLARAFYPNSFVEYAKEILDDCDSNSILFTSGDSDTFPLWYVQEKFGYRKDVKVINTSLAQTHWYQEYLLDTYNLKQGFTSEESRANLETYFVFTTDQRILFSEWLTQFQKEQPSILENGTYDADYIEVNGYWILDRGEDSILVGNNNSYVRGTVAFIYDLLTANSDLTVYGASIYPFYTYGLERYGRYHGSVVKMERFVPTSTFTEESEIALIQNLTALSDNYFAGLGNWRADQIWATLSRATRLSLNYSDQIVELIESKLVNKLTVDEIDPIVAHKICEFYKKFDEAKLIAFRSKFETSASAAIKEFNAGSISQYNNLDKLSDIASIYTNISGRDIAARNYLEPIKWKGSRSLYLLLKEKLLEMEKLCTERNLSVSLLRVRSLLTVLDAVVE